MKPSKINNENEIRWIKQWFKDQIIKGRLSIDLRAISLLENDITKVQHFVGRQLEFTEERQRLQKALSARRARASKPQRNVTTELERDAREMLLRVAESRCITTSELIRETFEDEYEHI